MSEYDRLVDILTELLCQFCPYCGTKLVKVQATMTTKNSGSQNGSYTYTYKVCPEGHVAEVVDDSWNPSDGNPEGMFEFDVQLFENHS